jgi:geranylgeranyl diphosphate synthase type II
MYNFNELSKIVEDKIQQIKLPENPELLYAPISYTLDMGGKRLRPVMCLMASDLFSGCIDNSLEACKAIEVFHNFTLLHDDLMDKAPIRRGKTTAYKKWSDNIAILSGDAMLIKSYQLLENVESNSFKEIQKVFSKFALEVCEGQQFDMDFEERMDVSLDEYINMIRLKTSVLFAGAMQIGAIIADASKEEQEKIYNFGLNFGLGFQLQDDFLDSFGDEETFGKTIGGDIVSNKKTALLIKAQELAKGIDAEELNYCLTHQFENNCEKIERVKQLYIKLEIDTYTKKLIESYYKKAYNILKSIDVDIKKKLELNRLLDKLMSRNK